MVLSDHELEDTEIDKYDEVFSRAGLEGIAEHLSVYEFVSDDLQAFYARARQITVPETRDLILHVLYELMLADGIPEAAESVLFKELNEIWS